MTRNLPPALTPPPSALEELARAILDGRLRVTVNDRFWGDDEDRVGSDIDVWVVPAAEVAR